MPAGNPRAELKDDTIYALATGTPPAAIAVIRISGPAAADTARSLTGNALPPRRATLQNVRGPRTGNLLDRALVIFFPGPATATGEDVLELHLHGGRAVVRVVEEALASLGLRQAEPGEFTRRALQNGRMDLSEAEALGDLLFAETETQRRMALSAAQGSIRQLVEEWQTRLLWLAADLEASIEFAEEGDVHIDVSRGQGDGMMRQLYDDMRAVLATPPVERLHHGVRVVLAGPPNAGKSTLLNAMAMRDAAIVSSIAGTTRDRIEIPVVRNGRAYILTDTAGLATHTDDPIEREGILRSRNAMSDADIVLWLGDDMPEDDAWIRLYPRCDLAGRANAPANSISISAKTGDGMTLLWNAIERRSDLLLPKVDEIAMNARQREHLAVIVDELANASATTDPVLRAEHLRIALTRIDRITGRSSTEHMLDALFSRFCIGK